MANGRSARERRKDKRLRAPIGAIALVKTAWPKSTIVGEVIDISKGGLAFRYLGRDEEPDGCCEVSVVLPDKYFYLDKLPANTVSDFKIAHVPFGTMAPRRRSVKFGALEPQQESRLEFFARNCMADTV